MAPSPGSSHPLRSCSLAAVAACQDAASHGLLCQHNRRVCRYLAARLVVYAKNKLPALNVWVQDEQLYVRGTT